MESVNCVDSFLHDSLIFNHPLRASSNYVSDIIQKAPGPANLKEVRSGKYLLVNKMGIKLSGLEPQDMGWFNCKRH